MDSCPLGTCKPEKPIEYATGTGLGIKHESPDVNVRALNRQAVNNQADLAFMRRRANSPAAARPRPIVNGSGTACTATLSNAGPKAPVG